MAIKPTMANTLEYGLISEFSYLTLESKYFQKVTTGDLNQQNRSGDNDKK
ncbi:hypothetical protein [Halarcobacter ebronensis]|nr:hypothetical protein [Halarcobacter ebronensis]